MNREDIIRMAIESQLIYDEEAHTPWIEDTNLTPFLERFAALVASTEREAIYNIVVEAPFRQNLETEPNGEDLLFAVKVMAFDITSAIRARGQS